MDLKPINKNSTKIIKCYKSNERGNYSWDCQKLRKLTRTVNSLMKKNPNKSQKLLFEICKQYDNQTSSSSKSSDESRIEEIFEETADGDTFETAHPPNKFTTEDFQKGIVQTRRVFNFKLIQAKESVLNLPKKRYLRYLK